MAKPVVILIISETARNNYFSLLALMWASKQIMLMTLLYISVFTIIAYLVFVNSLEGYSFLRTPFVALYEMFICFTSENYPNVMLPAYNANRWSSLFFIFYMVTGLFLMCNFLLAAIRTMYIQRA